MPRKHRPLKYLAAYTVKFPIEQRARLVATADKCNVSPAHVVRELVSEKNLQAFERQYAQLERV